MSDIPETTSASTGWGVALRTGAALAAAMGVGRFVFTPVLPLMEAQAHLAPASASAIATSNYLGYLVGAILGIVFPIISRSRNALRISAVALIISLAVMPLTVDVATWVMIRGVAGIASAVIFMVAGNTILTKLASTKPHIVGWAYGGVGAGIAMSGILVAVVSSVSDWRASWWSAAALTALLLAVGWFVGESVPRTGVTETTAESDQAIPSHRRSFIILACSYFFEGAGYIVAGTFLVAAVSATGPAWLGGSVWTIVGAAALPSCAAWTWLSLHGSRPTLLTAALVLQAVGIALPSISGAAAPAIVSAVLFGATFVGITTLSLATGRHLRVPRAIAILTAGYGIGQVVGPLIVAPTLSGGYRPALLVGACLVLVAAAGSALLRIRFPHHDQPHRKDRHFRGSVGSDGLQPNSEMERMSETNGISHRKDHHTA
ncbi:YbfB/YjiJ family MFS transporter [Glaciihabitans sp. UYNi722]|uniref:YbfB/YjiJ family MFS transporter n=1 Tax=Glaciihabitans sp. UYNi722 TaxID=3156344 RepID=UPI003393A4E9